MIMEQLLSGFDRADFLETYFLKLPFSLPGGASELQPLGQWPVVERIFERPDADAMFVKDGIQVPAPESTEPESTHSLFRSGHTVLVRHAERADADLMRLAGAFESDFGAPVDVHVYCTPAGRSGFGWHYDAEDVFILQTRGVKEYQLRKNTVNPWPVLEAMPRDMRYERELMPLMKCRLGPGDWLYIPNGYWHKATSVEDSISLAVGLMMPTPISLFPLLQQFLAESIEWRQRFPVTGAVAAIPREELRRQFSMTLERLTGQIEDAFRNPAFVSMAYDALFDRTRAS